MSASTQGIAARCPICSDAMTMAATTDDAFEVVPHRGLITACVMAATLMQTLDTTIVNVALPYIQGSLAASPDQIMPAEVGRSRAPSRDTEPVAVGVYEGAFLASEAPLVDENPELP